MKIQFGYIEKIHTTFGIISACICQLRGVKLLFASQSKCIETNHPFRPTRHIADRKTLGWAYLIIVVFSAILFTINVKDQTPTAFLPLTALDLSISQILLFTVAAIALLNYNYKSKEAAVFYLCAIGIGFWALASHFFTTSEQKNVFIFSCTVLSFIVARYGLDYSKISNRIHNVTPPEK